MAFSPLQPAFAGPSPTQAVIPSALRAPVRRVLDGLHGGGAVAAVVVHAAVLAVLLWLPSAKPPAPSMVFDLQLLEPVVEPQPEPTPKPEPVTRNAEVPPPPPEIPVVDPDPPPPVIESKPVVAEPPPPPRPRPIPPRPVPPVQTPITEAVPAPTEVVSPPPPTPAPPAPQTTRAAPGGGPPPDYLSRLSAHLERYKTYPRMAQQRHEEGVVRLRFALDRAGHLLGFSIEKSSGSSALDRAVETLVQRAQPFPPIPDTIEGNNLEISVPVVFSLRRTNDG